MLEQIGRASKVTKMRQAERQAILELDRDPRFNLCALLQLESSLAIKEGLLIPTEPNGAHGHISVQGDQLILEGANLGAAPVDAISFLVGASDKELLR